MSRAAEIFKEKGYDGTTLNDIAEGFGTDRASIYYYFSSKRELFQTILFDVVADVLDENLRIASDIAESDGTARDKIGQVVAQQLKSYEDNYPYLALYIEEDMGKLHLDRTPGAREMVRKTKQFEAVVLDILNTGVDRGEIRSDIAVTLMARALFGMVNWTHRWVKPGMHNVDAAKIASAFCTMFFDGVDTATPSAR